MKEIWKQIKGFEGHYEVSNLGEVRSVYRATHAVIRGKTVKRNVKGYILKPSIAMGYKRISLKVNGEKTEAKIHRLVALNFIPNPDNKEQVNHKNGIKIDNRVENLEWMTRVENTLHSIDTGLAYLKFDKFDYLHIRYLREKKIEITEIAKIFGSNQSHIRDIILHKTHR